MIAAINRAREVRQEAPRYRVKDDTCLLIDWGESPTRPHFETVSLLFGLERERADRCETAGVSHEQDRSATQ